MMFMTSEETFGSQRSLRGVPPSEKLHSLPKYTRNQDINTQEGNVARLPELTPALYHHFINCSWSLWYSEWCTNWEAGKHISWAKCASINISFRMDQVILPSVSFIVCKRKIYFSNSGKFSRYKRKYGRKCMQMSQFPCW